MSVVSLPKGPAGVTNRQSVPELDPADRQLTTGCRRCHRSRRGRRRRAAGSCRPWCREAAADCLGGRGNRLEAERLGDQDVRVGKLAEIAYVFVERVVGERKAITKIAHV